MGRKTPFVTARQLEDIASTYPTPFYLYDEAGIRSTAQSVSYTHLTLPTICSV